MKVVKVVSNRLVPVLHRKLRLKLECGHIVKLTMEKHMKPPTYFRWGCPQCRDEAFNYDFKRKTRYDF